MEAQIIKYVMRHGKKNKKQDLEKAQHFLQKLIELEYPEEYSTVEVNPDRDQTIKSFKGV